MCEYMWQICWCSSSLMLSSFAQDSDLSIRLPKIVIPEPRCLPGHNSVSLSDHFLPWSSTGGGALGTSCLGSWQILPPNFLVQGSQVRWQSGICTRSFLPWGQSTMWTQRAAQEWRTVAVPRAQQVTKTSRGWRWWWTGIGWRGSVTTKCPLAVLVGEMLWHLTNRHGGAWPRSSVITHTSQWSAMSFRLATCREDLPSVSEDSTCLPLSNM